MVVWVSFHVTIMVSRVAVTIKNTVGLAKFRTEPPDLFRSRGEHPKKDALKVVGSPPGFPLLDFFQPCVP